MEMGICVMATPRQIKAAEKIAENIRTEKPKPLGTILQEVGYSKSIAESPTAVTTSKGFQELLEEYLPDNDLALAHQSLLKSTKIDHMVFPLGPKGDADPNLSGSKPDKENRIEKAGVKVERTTLTDQEIKDMLAEVNCQVRRIVHGETARHVYFWSPDTQARHNALKLAYDVKGKAAAKGNTFIFNKGDVVSKKYVKD